MCFFCLFFLDVRHASMPNPRQDRTNKNTRSASITRQPRRSDSQGKQSAKQSGFPSIYLCAQSHTVAELLKINTTYRILYIDSNIGVIVDASNSILHCRALEDLFHFPYCVILLNECTFAGSFLCRLFFSIRSCSSFILTCSCHAQQPPLLCVYPDERLV